MTRYIDWHVVAAMASVLALALYQADLFAAAKVVAGLGAVAATLAGHRIAAERDERRRALDRTQGEAARSHALWCQHVERCRRVHQRAARARATAGRAADDTQPRALAARSFVPAITTNPTTLDPNGATDA